MSGPQVSALNSDHVLKSAKFRELVGTSPLFEAIAEVDHSATSCALRGIGEPALYAKLRVFKTKIWVQICVLHIYIPHVQV